MAINAISTGNSIADPHSASRSNSKRSALDGSSTNKPDRVRSQLAAETQPTLTDINHVELDANGAKEKTHDRAHGVLRLLEAGHFNATADARLRINFAKELAATPPTPEPDVETPNAAAALAESISTRATELLSPLATDEATAEGLAGLVESFSLAASSVELDQDIATVTDSIRTSFDGLVAGATELFSPTDDATYTRDPIEAPVATDPIIDEAVQADLGLEDAISALKTAFEDAITELVASFSEPNVETDSIEIENDIAAVSDLFARSTTATQTTTIDRVI